MTGLLAVATWASAHASTRSPEADLSEVAALVARETNAVRATHGLERLNANPALADAAQRFAEFMAGSDQYGHDADARKPADRARAAGYAYCVIAENIAYRFSSSGFGTEQLAAQLIQGWDQSPRHRHNMLLPNVVDIGVGIARSGRTQRYYAVQLFGRPKSASTRFEIANRADAAIRYELDGESYTLPPQVTRTHQGCYAGALRVNWADGRSSAGFEPRDGVRYIVQRDHAGRLQLHASQP